MGTTQSFNPDITSFGYASNYIGTAENGQRGENDLGILAIETRFIDNPPPPFGLDNIIENFAPLSHAYQLPLHTLPFMTSAENNGNSYPITFDFRNNPSTRFFRPTQMSGNARITIGASGSLVVDDEGKGIGIITDMVVDTSIRSDERPSMTAQDSSYVKIDRLSDISQLMSRAKFDLATHSKN